jgi:hypothetical protein
MITTTSKNTFIQELQRAIYERVGFAAGKIGFSEQALLGYSFFCNSEPSIQKRAYETFLKYHCDHMTGVFPSTPQFLEKFTPFYLQTILDMNFLGLMGGIREEELIERLEITAHLVHFQAMEPDRSIPEASSECYLPLFKNKRILLISPYAQFLKSRAQAKIYEDAWRSVGKKWFEPASILSLEIPYSFITATQTHKTYLDSLNLYKSICEQIDTYNYDIALIGAGALGIPLVSHIKSKGKIGLSLGGHLQIIFGVAGARWRRDPDWNSYLNDAWVDVPENYHPIGKDHLTDQGAYW